MVGGFREGEGCDGWDGSGWSAGGVVVGRDGRRPTWPGRREDAAGVRAHAAVRHGDLVWIMVVALWWGPVPPCNVFVRCRGSQFLPAPWRGHFAAQCGTRTITSGFARCGSDID